MFVFLAAANASRELFLPIHVRRRRSEYAYTFSEKWHLLFLNPDIITLRKRAISCSLKLFLR
jgi:hypothetical protein